MIDVYRGLYALDAFLLIKKIIAAVFANSVFVYTVLPRSQLAAIAYVNDYTLLQGSHFIIFNQGKMRSIDNRNV